MKYKITKTDKRHTGHSIMKYILELDFNPGSSKDDKIRWFKDKREWFWEHFGPGCELDYVAIQLSTTSTPGLADFGIPTVERWAWQTNFGHMRIYLKSDAEMTFFTLKFTT